VSYGLTHGPALRAAAPYTFFLPHPWLVNAVRVGDLVKLGFEYDPPGEKYETERMWVQVARIDGPTYQGHLVNQPDEPKPQISYGDEVRFVRENVLDVLLVDQNRVPDFESDRGRYPQLPEDREYWERCLVDECVIYDGMPVEYIYREEPDMADPDDKYPDSGWRIRGREGDSNDMDERKPAYVALGAVLNQDDSWLHLIDAPIGSAFMRNFETGNYEVAK
jgi:hypothetical protein